jgi:hypothetical protein
MTKRCKRDSNNRLANSKSSSAGSKKPLDGPLEQGRQGVDLHHQQISVRRPCQLRGVNRTGLYSKPVDEREEIRHLMGDEN